MYPVSPPLSRGRLPTLSGSGHLLGSHSPAPLSPLQGMSWAAPRRLGTRGCSGTPCLSPSSGEQPRWRPWSPPRSRPAHGTYFQNPGKNEDSFLNLCPIPLSGCPWPADLSERNRTEWNSTGAAGRTPRHTRAPTAAAVAPTCTRPAGLCTPQPRCPQPQPSPAEVHGCEHLPKRGGSPPGTSAAAVCRGGEGSGAQVRDHHASCGHPWPRRLPRDTPVPPP